MSEIQGKVLWVVVGTLAGAVAGGAASVWVAQRAVERDAKAAATRPSEPRPPAVTDASRPGELNGILTHGVARTLGDIEARVERLEAPQMAMAPESAAETPTPESYHQRHAETIRQHLEELVDPDWGPHTKALVEEAFESLKHLAPIDVREIECRSESCRAVVRWESLEIATDTYQRLVVSPIRLGCGRTILLPDGPATGPIEVTMTFDCAEWKAGGSKPLSAELLPKLGALTVPH